MEDNIEEIQKAYDELGEKLKKLKSKPNRNDFKSIKTLADACIVVDKDYITFLKTISNLSKDTQAYESLKIIIEAINPEGWRESIDWNNTSQQKWYPYFNCSGSFGFLVSRYYSASAYSFAGARLCFSSRDRSDYAGKQFLDLYEDFIK